MSSNPLGRNLTTTLFVSPAGPTDPLREKGSSFVKINFDHGGWIIFGRRQLFDNRLPLAVIIHSPRRNFDICDSGHLEAELKIAVVGSSVELDRVVWEQTHSAQA